MPHDQAYFLAENKIEQALKSDATELALKEMRLAKTPESKQVQQMIHPNSCQKPNSPSPFWGKLEGDSHAP